MVSTQYGLFISFPHCICLLSLLFFFFNDTATTEIYTLSLHDALPISPVSSAFPRRHPGACRCPTSRDRKSTRLNSSHVAISYAVFCMKKKKNRYKHHENRARKDCACHHEALIETY